MIWAALILGAFLSGSIPFGLLIARAKGIDIRAHGSKNIGATNVGRVLGRKWGFLCLALDALKAFAPVALCGRWSGLWGDLAPPLNETVLWLLVLAAAISGHVFSPWVGFKGGKGVASSLGGMLGFFPLLTVPGLGALATFIVVLKVWRYVSLASCIAAATVPILTLLTPLILRSVPGLHATTETDSLLASWPVALGVTPVSLLVIYRHRANIARLRAGTEPRIGRHG